MQRQNSSDRQLVIAPESGCRILQINVFLAYLGHRFASTKAVAQITESFVESIRQFGLDHKIELVRFQKGQRKDDVMQARLRAFKKKHPQGVVFIGVAQEKARARLRNLVGPAGFEPTTS